MEFRLRASPEQFAIMLDFMERNGDLSRPQPGAQGRLRAEHQWNELTELLNSVGGNGVQKSADKWKRVWNVWSDWKTKTKKKASLIRTDTQGTGGGPSRARPLNPLEERLLRIIGITSIVGQQEIQEAGFVVQPSEPAVRELSPQPTPPPASTSLSGVVVQTSECAVRELPPQPTPAPAAEVVLIPEGNVLPELPNMPSNSRRHEDVLRSPSAGPSTPRRRRVIGQRRRRYQTPFEQATSEFVRIEESRLRLQDQQNTRQHEREMEQLRMEARRIAMEESRNNILQRIADIVNSVMEILLQSRLVRD